MLHDSELLFLRLFLLSVSMAYKLMLAVTENLYCSVCCKKIRATWKKVFEKRGYMQFH